MDSITQIVLGASIAELVANRNGRSVGNKAMLYGAIAGTIPDLDIIPASMFDTVTQLSIHRGFSHSIIFCIFAAPIFGWLVHKFHHLIKVKRDLSMKTWSWLFFWALFTHPILDCFTTWGTQLFWPLENRISFKSIFVIDPIYTIPFLLFLIWASFLKTSEKKMGMRSKINKAGLIFSSLYLLFTLANKIYINGIFEISLKKKNISAQRYMTAPMPFNNVLWRAIVETEKEYLLTYYSWFDDAIPNKFLRFKKNHQLLKQYQENEQLQKLLQITDQFYKVNYRSSGTSPIDKSRLVIDDLRFGMAKNWNNQKGEFVFSYYVSPIENSDALLIDQKKNSFKGTSELAKQLWARIKGIKSSSGI